MKQVWALDLGAKVMSPLPCIKHLISLCILFNKYLVCLIYVVTKSKVGTWKDFKEGGTNNYENGFSLTSMWETHASPRSVKLVFPKEGRNYMQLVTMRTRYH